MNEYMYVYICIYHISFASYSPSLMVMCAILFLLDELLRRRRENHHRNLYDLDHNQCRGKG
jgi:hypothetical protein